MKFRWVAGSAHGCSIDWLIDWSIVRKRRLAGVVFPVALISSTFGKAVGISVTVSSVLFHLDHFCLTRTAYRTLRSGIGNDTSRILLSTVNITYQSDQSAMLTVVSFAAADSDRLVGKTGTRTDRECGGKLWMLVQSNIILVCSSRFACNSCYCSPVFALQPTSRPTDHFSKNNNAGCLCCVMHPTNGWIEWHQYWRMSGDVLYGKVSKTTSPLCEQLYSFMFRYSRVIFVFLAVWSSTVTRWSICSPGKIRRICSIVWLRRKLHREIFLRNWYVVLRCWFMSHCCFT